MALGNSPSDPEELCHGIVGNIPVEFHSADLRSFFSHFIESAGFDCFHFRHRPEVQISTGSTTEDVAKGKVCCCVVRLSRERMSDFVKTYHGHIWVDKNKKSFAKRAVVSRIKVEGRVADEPDEPQYQTKKEIQQHVSRKVEFSRADLDKLPELHPPHMMPNGNVGTPTSIFLELIRSCKLPPKIVSKLGLTFPKNSSSKKYGNMPFDYSILNKRRTRASDDDKIGEKPENSNISSGGVSCSSDGSSGRIETTLKAVQDKQVLSTMSKHGISKSSTTKPQSKSLNNFDPEVEETGPVDTGVPDLSETGAASGKKKGSKLRSEESFTQSVGQAQGESDGEVEDWERHEALHNDVDNQGRTRERLFEEEIELKWEKGGSGLVFYTDAAYWRQREEGDMDEEMADDWDIDMEVYEESGGGDKDSWDLLQMRTEEQWRRGNEVDPNRIGGFEKFTKGFGGRLMREQGWKEGKGLGSSQVGIAEPVSAEGQTPHSKRGLGYFGEKLDRNVQVKRARADREVRISTIYDEPDGRSVNVFQSQGPYILTYRDNVEFVPATNAKERKVKM